MDPPETRYAKSGEIDIACQVVGDGPIDIVFVPGFVSNLDATWEAPGTAAFYSRTAGFSRLILFDKRGTGLSDRLAGIAMAGPGESLVSSTVRDLVAGSGPRFSDRGSQAMRGLPEPVHLYTVLREN